jgi:hypothetical protein
MRGLKALVFIMGALIVIGFAVVVVTLVNRSGVSSGGRDSAPSPRIQTTTPYKTKITIPAGSRITETSAADGRLIIRLTGTAGAAGAAGAARILVIDLATGRQIGAIDLPKARP